MKISPGTMVRITQDVWEITNGPMYLDAPEGSIARAMSYEEYCDYVFKNNGKTITYRLEYVKEWMEKDEQFPFTLVEVAPVSETRYSDKTLIPLKAGEVVMLDEKFFQIIEVER